MATTGPGDAPSPRPDDGLSPWGVRLRAAVAGVGAWLAGYVVAIGFASTLGLTEGAGSVSDVGNFSFVEVAGPSGSEVLWKMGGTVFYAAHFVPTEVGISVDSADEIGSFAGSISVGFNLIPDVVPQEGPQWLLVLLVPPLALTAAGFLAARWARVDPASAVRTGAAVAIGYLPLSVGGLFVFGIAYSATAPEYGRVEVFLGPELLMGIVLAGVVYPLAFGALGGYLWRRQETGGARGRPPQGGGPPRR